MILLSGCEPEGEDDAAVAYVEVTRESPFFDHEAGGVPGCVALEYMAQTMALSSGRKRRRAGLPPAIGFVLGSRRMTVSIPFFREGRRYRVRAKCAYSDEEYGAFDCSVEDQDGAVVASAQITAYQPEAGEL
jgi:predicted hotdog family 3-hydroxylacyl-ACP dehydratase